MSFRRGGGGRKRDAIEPDVIKELRAVGTQVWQINGHALPDLLTYRSGRWLPLGLKSGARASLTQSEKDKPPVWPLARSVDEALQAVGAVARSVV